MTGSAIPSYTDTFSRMAVWSIFLQIVIIIAEGMLADGSSKPAWTGPCKMFFLFLLYIGFGGLVYSSFVIGVPPTAHNGIMALAAPPQPEMPGVAPVVQQATPAVLSPALPKPAEVAPPPAATQQAPSEPAQQPAAAPEEQAKKAEQERKEAEKIVADTQQRPTDTQAHQQAAAEEKQEKVSTMNLVSAQEKLQESANKETTAATEEAAVKPRKPAEQATLDAEVPALVKA